LYTTEELQQYFADLVGDDTYDGANKESEYKEHALVKGSVWTPISNSNFNKLKMSKRSKDAKSAGDISNKGRSDPSSEEEKHPKSESDIQNADDQELLNVSMSSLKSKRGRPAIPD
jgi:hypothetical protein